MVLWEITLATAYFLGLRRTYRLALRIQRRVITPRHPDLRRFVHRRIRGVFDVVVKIQQRIQQRDIGAGRNIGSSILRWLNNVKPSAQRDAVNAVEPPTSSSIRIPKYAAATRSRLLGTQRRIVRITDHVKRGRSFFTPCISMRTVPTIEMMMRPWKPAGLNGQYRHISLCMPNPQALVHNRRIGSFDGVLRRDIAQWIVYNS